MFARPASAVGSPRAVVGRPSAVLARLGANPIVAAGVFGGLVAVVLAGLIVVAGDPRAGAPSVRVKLAEPGRLPSSAGLRGIEPAAGAAPADSALGGQAVITLPQGGRVAGAADPPGLAAPAPAPAPPLAPPLAPAPIAGLTAPGPGGLLPIVGRDGRTSFAAYARPFAPNGRPRIAMIVGGLGLNAAATRAAITRLPADITLSFVPYADGLQAWVDQARAAGHEVVLEAPMEPLDYPNNDPGPYGLMAQAPAGETVRRLEWLLSRTTGYFSVTNYLGSRFMESESAMATLTGVLHARGLGFVDDGTAPRRGLGAGVPRASADAVIDQDLSAEAIDRSLASLEAAALQRGQAFGAGFAYPVTVDQLARWVGGLAGRGYQLAPVSAIMRR